MFFFLPSQQLQQEKKHLRVQHSSHLISGDKFKNVQGHPVLRARLKHAALCITRLIKEKQHLIEMCNRLRGMKSSSGFKGAVRYTQHTPELVCHFLFTLLHVFLLF